MSGDFKSNSDELKLYYLEVEIINNVPKLTFELMSERTTTLSLFIKPQIDIIESNGIYSYSVRRIITGGQYMNRYQSKIQVDCYNYFWAITHTKNFPYSVYFNQDMILFISRNRKFDRKALNLDKIDDLLTFIK